MRAKSSRKAPFLAIALLGIAPAAVAATIRDSPIDHVPIVRGGAVKLAQGQPNHERPPPPPPVTKSNTAGSKPPLVVKNDARNVDKAIHRPHPLHH